VAAPSSISSSSCSVSILASSGSQRLETDAIHVVPPQFQTNVRAWEAFLNGPSHVLICIKRWWSMRSIMCAYLQRENEFSLRIARSQYRGLSADNF
jgi:hypothetical protein